MPVLEIILKWLNAHPWGWFALLGSLLLLFVGWMATPFTWRDAEGSIVAEGQATANFWDGILRMLWWR